MMKVGSDFSGVGAFDQALKRLKIPFETVFACDMDKYARQTYIANHGEPNYYPENVYEREIPKESLDIYMTSPPCQAFSLAGKRKGEDDDRGILFYNSHEFIKVNKPRYFIFENVKGLLSDFSGKTFQRWLDYLGGKSVNGLPVLFAHEEAVPYHIYYKVLNSKHYGVPQNRERIFIIGIRDDQDNSFTWPKEIPLENRLKDVLEDDVDDKYYLSDKAIKHLFDHKDRHDKKGTGFGVNIKSENDVAATLRANGALCPTDNHIKVSKEVRSEEAKSRESGLPTEQHLEINENGTSNALTSVQKDNLVVQIKSATSKGYEVAQQGDSINLSQPNSKTRRGRVGKGVAQTLDTACNQAVFEQKIRRLTPRECFRLQDFEDSFVLPCSDTQSYKQAGNSITVGVLEAILRRLL